MKKFIFGFALLCALTISSCGGNKKTTETEVVETEVVEQVTTEVTDTIVVEEVIETEKVDESI